MPRDIWGASTAYGIDLPVGAAGYALLILCVLLFALAVYWLRDHLCAISRRQWPVVAALAVAALVCSQLFPLDLPWQSRILGEAPPTSVAMPLAAAPYLLAGAIINPAAALIVGLFGGLGRAAGQTHSLVDIFAVSLAAACAAVLMRHRYSGIVMRWLARPPIAGAIGLASLAAFTAMRTFATVLPAAGFLGAADLGLTIGVASLVPLVLEGLAGGVLVALWLWAIPAHRPAQGTLPTPARRSLQGNLVTGYLAFAAVFLLATAIAVYVVSARTAARAAVAEMVAGAELSAAALASWQGDVGRQLASYGNDQRLVTGARGEKARLLREMSRSSERFSSLQWVDSADVVINETASPVSVTSLRGLEQTAVARARQTGRSWLGVDPSAERPQALLAVPVGAGGPESEVILGHVSESSLEALVKELPVLNGEIHGRLVDERAQVVLGDPASAVGQLWTAPDDRDLTRWLSDGSRAAVATRLNPQTGARELEVNAPVSLSLWQVVATVPSAVVLRRALVATAPVALLLGVISALFLAQVIAFGRSVSEPIAEMAAASKAIAGGGGLERTVRSRRDDEIGQLSHAFAQMQRSLKQRIDELSLLLSVSNEVSANINISHGMASVLQGVVRGTGAAGARAVVRNPSDTHPLIFVEGPAAAGMAALDRLVISRIVQGEEIVLSSPQEVERSLGIENSPVAALCALPLRSESEFQGALLVGYRQPHYFDSAERNLLRTLAGQATVLVHNAYLFAAAEGGRRRLGAILSSTSNAVIVTDQNDRVLLLNPAMEQAFGLSRDIVNRPVSDVVGHPQLVERLILGNRRDGRQGPDQDGKLELAADGRTFLASIATVRSGDGQAMGRVAVMQDVTDLKELERMKSDFLAGVSHDLLSPLTYMRNYASMLPLAEEPELQGEYTEKILSGIDRMTRLVNELLELARIEAGINMSFEPLEVEALLEEIAQEYWSVAHDRGVKIVVAPGQTGLTLEADAHLLRRALTNLVINGIKYAPDSGELTLAFQGLSDEVLITVHDRGPGIEAHDLPRLFEKFYRGRRISQDGPRGSGLGLAVVKSVVDHHGGRVWCESQPGDGTTFLISLPATQPDQLEA